MKSIFGNLARALGLTTVVLVSCQSIVGLETREYDAVCEPYCAEVMKTCTDANQVYENLEICRNVCKLLPPGDANEPTGNTVACRRRQVGLAASAGVEKAGYCSAAGPTGNGSCGTNCDAYCELFGDVCGAQTMAPPKDCQQACQGLTNTGHFTIADSGHVHADRNDTIQCRLYHVSAATADPATHCSHASIAHPSAFCINDPTTVPTCDEYCNLITAVCTGENAQYPNEDDCLAFCAKIPNKGLEQDSSGNTLGCRKYHAYNAVIDPDVHCPHAGPDGAGVCSDAM